MAKTDSATQGNKTARGAEESPDAAAGGAGAGTSSSGGSMAAGEGTGELSEEDPEHELRGEDQLVDGAGSQMHEAMATPGAPEEE